MSDSNGALVGWSAQNLGSRVVLKLEAVNKPAPHEPTDIHAHLFLMDKTQAIQLGHYLYSVIGETVPAPRRRPLFERLFGGRRR